MHVGRMAVVAPLGAAQTLAWASSYYLPAVLAAPMARDTGVPDTAVFGMFSAALALSAVVGPRVGRTIDRIGGRPVLMATSVAFSAGLAGLALAQGAVSLLMAWLVLGLAMGAGLYDAAFAALVRWYGADARSPITGITLIAGFASTVGWPVSSLLTQTWGWREACLAWAALHLLVGLPLHAVLPRLRSTAAARPTEPPSTALGASAAPHAEAEKRAERPTRCHTDTSRPSEVKSTASRRSAGMVLAFVFAANGFVGTALAAQLPSMLHAWGATTATALHVGMLIGPAQVLARLLEFSFLRRLHPLHMARLGVALHPLGAVALAAFGLPAAMVFGVLHGAGNGLMTIAKGTLPLALFGAQGYGERQGWLMVPARVAQAASPWLFGLCVAQWGVGALALTAGLMSVACLTLLATRTTTHRAAERPADAGGPMRV